jgi:general secretion pathway protein G
MRTTVFGLKMKKAFTLVEIIIVVTVLGILAAIVVPVFQGHVTESKSTAAKDNLRILRSVISLYAAEHNGAAPGFYGGDTTTKPSFLYYAFQLLASTNQQSKYAAAGTAGYPFGPYFSELPKNPFNNQFNLLVLDDTDDFPAEATGTYGFIYKPITKTIRLDWPGTDFEGASYYSY